MAQVLRTFIAIELSKQVTRELAAIQKQLQTHGLKLRWVRPGNIHLTLRFLGDVASADIERIATAVQVAADQSCPFELAVQGLGVFPGIRRPRILWTGLGGVSDQLVQMQQHLDDALAAQGVARPKRSFQGHLTLARIKPAVDTSVLKQAIQTEGTFAPLRLVVDQIVLFQSRLHSSGAEYIPLFRSRLANQ